MSLRLAIKVDVDTDRGTRFGVPALYDDCREFGIPACFLFSLGADQTGRAISRVFRPGFFKKVSRTSVVKVYGLRTLLNGTLLPAPDIGRRNRDIIRRAHELGYEVGIHCNNHYFWQDHVMKLPLERIRADFGEARRRFRDIFGFDALTCGAPGWQSNERCREVYDESGLLYTSDTRGFTPFFPTISGRRFKTLEIPTTLPTLDELLGRPEFPDTKLVAHYLSLLREDRVNVITVHAELEGMACRPFFRELIKTCLAHGVQFVRLDDEARSLLARAEQVSVGMQAMEEIDGRSGLVAVQKKLC